jgi:hypothetical protein
VTIDWTQAGSPMLAAIIFRGRVFILVESAARRARKGPAS